MYQHKAESSTALAYAVSIGGVTMGEWLVANWFQLLSAIFLVLTFATHIWFQTRKDRRERAANKRQERIHLLTLQEMGAAEARQVVHDAAADVRREEIHDETMRELKHIEDEVE